MMIPFHFMPFPFLDCLWCMFQKGQTRWFTLSLEYQLKYFQKEWKGLIQVYWSCVLYLAMCIKTCWWFVPELKFLTVTMVCLGNFLVYVVFEYLIRTRLGYLETTATWWVQFLVSWDKSTVIELCKVLCFCLKLKILASVFLQLWIMKFLGSVPSFWMSQLPKNIRLFLQITCYSGSREAAKAIIFACHICNIIIGLIWLSQN